MRDILKTRCAQNTNVYPVDAWRRRDDGHFLHSRIKERLKSLILLELGGGAGVINVLAPFLTYLHKTSGIFLLPPNNIALFVGNTGYILV